MVASGSRGEGCRTSYLLAFLLGPFRGRGQGTQGVWRAMLGIGLKFDLPGSRSSFSLLLLARWKWLCNVMFHQPKPVTLQTCLQLFLHVFSVDAFENGKPCGLRLCRLRHKCRSREVKVLVCSTCDSSPDRVLLALPARRVQVNCSRLWNKHGQEAEGGRWQELFLGY